MIRNLLLLIALLFCGVAAHAQDSVQRDVKPSINSLQTFEPDTVFSKGTIVIDSLKPDSTVAKKTTLKRHSPGKAAWMSAVLPGLGQAYNKRWWKIPIVYAGFAGLGYGLYHFGSNYRGYRSAYRQNVDYDTTYIASFKGVSDVNELRSYRDFHKRNLDIMAVITAVWYVLNIVDAVVDAHLFHWDVDDKLALDLQPIMPTYMPQARGYSGVAGLNLQLSFKPTVKRKIFQL